MAASLRTLSPLLLVLGLALAAASTGWGPHPAAETPSGDPLEPLLDYRPPAASIVYDRNSREIGQFYVQRRRLVRVDEVPEHVAQAFVASEDGRFFQHNGLDLAAVLRAAWANLRGGRVEQGASTITQQMVKNVLLTPERTWERKLREMQLALEVERRLDKHQILLIYLNQIYFGNGSFGIGDAARSYFGKEVPELDLSEAAMLAGLPQRPSAYSPVRHPEAAEVRRRYVLDQMLARGFIDSEAHRRAWASPPHLVDHAPGSGAADAAEYFTEQVRRELIDRIGSARLYRGGLRIETTVDLDLQRHAQAAVRRGLEALDRRSSDRQSARRSVGAPGPRRPPMEGALLSLDVGSGDVLAMVGGYDFDRSEFNRAIQAHRQPGSAFKPLVYAAAIEAGYSQASFLLDAPHLLFDRSVHALWRPQNYGRRFRGWLTVRRALAQSSNNATIDLARRVGVDHVADIARRLGIRSALGANLSLALGTSEVSLLDLTRAYAAFAAGGQRVRPHLVRRVLDRDGAVVIEDLDLVPAADGDAPDAGEVPQAVSPQVARVMTDLLQAVVFEPGGTGARARELGRPVAGKTGTTNGYRDAWFVGYSPEVATGVWVGFDRPRSLGPRETGARAALPIWMDFMARALESRPARGFETPEGVVLARVDSRTGLLGGADDPWASWQAFLPGTEPTRATSRPRELRSARRELLRDDF